MNPGSSGTDSQNRNVVYFLVTRIEDRFGNWVTYQYSGNHLQSIASKDGRRIDLVWNGDNVASASSSLGTWRYGYDGTALRAVTRPDESKWQFASSGDMKILPDNSPPIYEQTPQCLPPFIGTGSFDYTITDPSGASALFTFVVARHHRGNVPKYCNSFPMPGGGAGGMVSL